MKRVVFSGYKTGEDVTVKHTYHEYAEGETVTVKDPKKTKVGGRYVIEVENAHGRIGKIPTKYIKKKSAKQKHS